MNDLDCDAAARDPAFIARCWQTADNAIRMDVNKKTIR
jgi:hypothetical protein